MIYVIIISCQGFVLLHFDDYLRTKDQGWKKKSLNSIIFYNFNQVLNTSPLALLA